MALFFRKIHIPSLVNGKTFAKNSATSIPTGLGFLKFLQHHPACHPQAGGNPERQQTSRSCRFGVGSQFCTTGFNKRDQVLCGPQNSEILIRSEHGKKSALTPVNTAYVAIESIAM